MNFIGIDILLPGHGWEEISSLDGHFEAESLLAAVSAAWHPAVIHAVGGIARFQPIYDLETPEPDRLWIVPPSSEADFQSITPPSTVPIVRPTSDRAATLAQLWGLLGIDPAEMAGRSEQTDQAFWTLGLLHFQIRQLTYHLHYSSGLDEQALGEIVARAAALEGKDDVAAYALLKEAHELLKTERWNYYPVDAYLLDLAVLSERTSPQPIRWGGASTAPASLLVTGHALDEILQQQPDVAERLCKDIEADRLCLLGGEFQQPAWMLMSCESVLNSLMLGHECIAQHGIPRPTFFARRRFGLTPLVVQVLASLGYQGLVQSILDGGRQPVMRQPRSRWILPDGQSIAALGKLPLNAHEPVSVATLGARMGSAMDLDHQATLLLARWADQPAAWWTACRDASMQAGELGKVVTLAEYFQAECHRVSEEPLTSAHLVSPHLSEAVARGDARPISRWVAITESQLQAEQAGVLHALTEALGRDANEAANEAADEKLAEARVELASTQPDVERLSNLAGGGQQAAARRFADAIVGTAASAATNPARGTLLINPLGFARPVYVRSAQVLRKPPQALAWSTDGDGTEAVVEVPPCGYVWMRAEPAADDQVAPDSIPTESTPTVMGNNLLEVHLDPDSGGIRSVYDLRTRGNRLSQRVQCHWPQRFGPQSTCRTECESVRIVCQTPVRQSRRTTSKVYFGQELIGRVEQTVTVIARCRRMELGIRLLTDEIPQDAPWMNYWSSTLALPNTRANLFRGVNWQRGTLRADAPRTVESCWYLDWLDGSRRTTLLPAGLPFHVRRDRFLDTLLAAGSETERQFRIGLALDVSDALRESLDFAAPPLVVEDVCALEPSAGWLFHVDARHVIMTAIEPLRDAATVSGLRVRLLEASGRGGPLTVRTFREIREARQLDFRGHLRSTCTVERGAARFEIKPHEWTEIELHW